MGKIAKKYQMGIIQLLRFSEFQLAMGKQHDELMGHKMVAGNEVGTSKRTANNHNY
jgi:hypothetical protein